KPGLISQDEMAAIFERAEEATNGHSAIASVVPAWFTLPHQINATFYSVLGAQEVPYLLARAVQHFLPGRPQVYYVGLLGGLDDTELFARTRNGRDVNRHTYSADELASALNTDITRAQLGLGRLRSSHRAFDGVFSWSVVAPDGLELRWENGDARAVLTVWTTLDSPSFEIALTDDGRTQVFDTVASVANWDSGLK
ncbi:MAG TPA: sucrose phosphorylase, partial [Glaciibacter sp.]|nr:sucrose phosphorylase [Glaciibacter sp.]